MKYARCALNRLLATPLTALLLMALSPACAGDSNSQSKPKTQCLGGAGAAPPAMMCCDLASGAVAPASQNAVCEMVCPEGQEIFHPDKGGIPACSLVDAGAPDAGSTVDADPVDVPPVDTNTAFNCDAGCNTFKVCGSALAQDACLALCTDTATADGAKTCLTTKADCDSFIPCMLALTKPTTTPLRTFDDGKAGYAFRALAGDFTVPTTAGDWHFADHYDGHDSYLFAFMGKDLVTYKDQQGKVHDYLAQIWYGATVADLTNLLKASPKNVHYFFVPYTDKGGGDGSKTHLDSMSSRFEEALKAFSPVDRAWWKSRIHYVTKRAPLPNQPTAGGGFLDGWLADYTAKKGPFNLGIDRFQRIRQIGSLSYVGSPKMHLFNFQFEAHSYNFEFEREGKLDKNAKIVSIVDKVPTKTSEHDVELPPASEMATYDTLEVDLGHYCKDHMWQNCFEWDTGARLYVVERPAVEPDPVVGQACEGTATQACDCITPRQETVARTRNCKKAKDGKSTWGACACQKTSLVQRWITTYKREGRWVSDASHALYHLAKGGKVRFRYECGYAYILDMKLRLRKTGKGGVPNQVVPLFTGGAFKANYNDKYKPKTVAIPKSAKRVEVVTVITGHGWGHEKANCAEFCNHTHHFKVGDKTFVRDHPWVGDNFGCAKQIDKGVVPNQFGTWTLGRAGWCPGLEVTPTIWDVSKQAPAGKEVVISYQGLFQGKTYVPEKAPPGQYNKGGFGAQINMDSWLLIYQ